MSCSEGIYVDEFSDVDDNTNSENDRNSDSGSDIVARRFINNGRPVINDSDSGEEIFLSNDWSKIDFEPNLHRCLEESGLQTPCLPDIMSSVELFLDDDLFNLFTRETSLYYFQQKNNNVNELTKNKDWTNTTIAEMKKFLGLVIIMGVAKKPERDDYWATHPVLYSPIFGNTMPRNRFRQLWRYWHFNNNEFM